MTATARKDYSHEITLPTGPGVYPEDDLEAADAAFASIGNAEGTEYATRGARGHRTARPQLRIVSPLRQERASRGVFALVVVGLLILGMIVILVINTALAQGAFTVSELQNRQAALAQQEQGLSQAVAAAAAPDTLEKSAQAMGMVPSQTPVFLKVPSGKVLGRAAAAPGGTAAEPRLLTPADATATEAVDNASVGTDLPIAPGVKYDPAAADAAAAQAAAANAPLLITPAAGGAPLTPDGGAPLAPKTTTGKNAEKKVAGVSRSPAAAKPTGKKGSGSENSLWSDSTVIDVTQQLSSSDSGLSAVRVP
jgi:hypothetical protein